MRGWSGYQNSPIEKEKPTSEEVTQVQDLLYEMETNPGSYPIPSNTQKIIDKYPDFNWGESKKIKEYQKEKYKDK